MKTKKKILRNFSKRSSNGLLFDFFSGLNYFHHLIDKSHSPFFRYRMKCGQWNMFFGLIWNFRNLRMLASIELAQFAWSCAKSEPRRFHNGESSLNRSCEITLGNVNTCWISTVYSHFFPYFSISCESHDAIQLSFQPGYPPSLPIENYFPNIRKKNRNRKRILLTLTKLTPKHATQAYPPSGATFLVGFCMMSFRVCVQYHRLQFEIVIQLSQQRKTNEITSMKRKQLRVTFKQPRFQ